MSSVSATPDETVPEPVARTPMPVTAVPPASLGAVMLSRIVLGLLSLMALVALVLVIVLWQKVGGMQEQLARQSADAMAQSLEARTLARQAHETVRDTAARLALTETRVAEVALQRSQLEELMQSLSRSRDENLVVDIESAVRLALQQAQVTGNVEPLLAALKAADVRITRAAQPRLAPLQRAVQRDADRLRATASGDGGEALQKLDELMRGVDDLPTLNAVGVRSGGTGALQSEPIPADAPWWKRILMAAQAEARSLVRVGRIERPEAVLLSPDQTFFLRENLKLKLLNARLALLSRQVDTARSELALVAASLNRYFDPASRRVQTAATLLQQVQLQVRTAETPRVDDTLAALSTAAAGR
ncbi:uroporphyrinogen-III C-methyltransferase [Variovorax arabinosiphilus]|uniref:uroporphyrinogen-III C-methyltransferase n=1 Tax=Variovorax arabinosiphilus TaxID=3053498 RepID=UPI002578FB14|nr:MULTISPECIES: uroporphyrinogen-III C-methyltransferase [unclassified Variovorax]MDM0123126.1 uroporphyrinogen-III C-methyltransferase [Variovorax sp. J2L1-78]MDM0131878.1 uroporphyrinogen-III C-methyltransferase [Variovorax sp. J2L1-63]MDM0235889.1 uroporphyrinogen-III C-methyltransferase [Variovorax sp. J2R1-6]